MMYLPLRNVGFSSSVQDDVIPISLHHLPEERIDRESSTSSEYEDEPKGWMKALASVFDSTKPLAVCIVRILSNRFDVFLSFSVQEETPIICRVAPKPTIHHRSLDSMTSRERDGSAPTSGKFL